MCYIEELNQSNLNWNAKKWKQEFSHCLEDIKTNINSQQKVRHLRADVFQNTLSIVHKGSYSSVSGCINLPDGKEMAKKTKFYKDRFSVADIPTISGDTTVVVENIDCLKAALKLKEKGYNPAVLNMANRRNPGGGVLNGAGAQEENIFRRSNLFLSLYQFASYANTYGINKSSNQYPMDKDFGGIYTPNAVVFRDTENTGYDFLEQWYSVSFISVAGMSRPQLDYNGLIVGSLIEPIKNKIRTILRIGLINGHDSLVLGALGCGAFCNPPSQIANLFHQIFEEVEFKNKFKLFYFAILEDHNSSKAHNPNGNFKPFQEEFSVNEMLE